MWQAHDVLDDVSAGDWVTAGLPRFGSTVGSLVPPIYPAYARILHPAMRVEPHSVNKCRCDGQRSRPPPAR